MMKRDVLTAVLMCALASIAGAQTATTVRLSGRAMDTSGAVLPGVTVTLTGASSRNAVTDADGRYVFTDLTPGYYMLTGTLAGFGTATRTVVAAAPGSFAMDLVLRLPCIFPDLLIEEGLPHTLASSNAVLYVRIEDAGRLVSVGDGGECVKGYEHRATVLDVVKAPRLTSDVIRLVHARNMGYRTGDEYILFLRRHSSGALVDFGLYAFPVINGRVRWTRDDLPGVIDGSAVRDVLEGLRRTLAMNQ
jgi:hypothetical protein